MLASETEIIQLRQQQRQSYQQLSTLRRQIVRLFSVIYEPVNRSAFLKCLDSVGEKQDNGKAFNSKTLNPISNISWNKIYWFKNEGNL